MCLFVEKPDQAAKCSPHKEEQKYKITYKKEIKLTKKKQQQYRIYLQSPKMFSVSFVCVLVFFADFVYNFTQFLYSDVNRHELNGVKQSVKHYINNIKTHFACLVYLFMKFKKKTILLFLL